MKIALLSHRGGNIGHDFMAIGVEEILRSICGKKLEIVHFEQHHHFSTYPSWQPLRLLHLVPHGRLRSLRQWINKPEKSEKLFSKTRDLSDFSLAIACGGPNLVKGLGGTPEMGLMFHHLNGAFSHHGVPVLDMAVGACFPLERVPQNIDEAFTERDQDCLKRLFGVTCQTTVRDKLAKKLLKELGRDALLIPCAALCSGIAFRRWVKEKGTPRKDLILINFQHKGANDDWGQQVDPNKWRSTVRKAAEQLSKRNEIVFICQSKWEKKLADRNFPEYSSCHPQTTREYAFLIARAKVALVSRIHCAIPLAGMGTPSIVVGTDSRTWTTDEVHLPSRYVKEVDAAYVVDTVEHLLEKEHEHKYTLDRCLNSTMESYGQVIGNLI